MIFGRPVPFRRGSLGINEMHPFGQSHVCFANAGRIIDHHGYSVSAKIVRSLEQGRHRHFRPGIIQFLLASLRERVGLDPLDHVLPYESGKCRVIHFIQSDWTAVKDRVPEAVSNRSIFIIKQVEGIIFPYI